MATVDVRNLSAISYNHFGNASAPVNGKQGTLFLDDRRAVTIKTRGRKLKMLEVHNNDLFERLVQVWGLQKLVEIVDSRQV